MKNQPLSTLSTLLILVLIFCCAFKTTDNTIERYISVKLLSTHQIYNNKVGHDWEHFLSVNKQIIKKDEEVIFKLKRRAPLNIEAHAIEKDKQYDDHGKESMPFTYSDLIAVEKASFEVRIIVMENGGQNAGNLAEWMYIFELARAEKPVEKP